MAGLRNAISQAIADGRYLKLDCTNDPLTGGLDINTSGDPSFLIRNASINQFKVNATEIIIYGGPYSFKMTAAPLAHDPGGGSVNYDQNFDTAAHDTAYVISDRTTPTVVECKTAGEPFTIAGATGTEDWGVACMDIASGTLYLTMYFKDSEFTDGPDIAAWLDAIAGSPGVTCDYYRESVWTNNGATSSYTWANPDGKSIVSGFTTPPTFIAYIGEGFNLNVSTGDVEMVGDFTNPTTTAVFDWEGEVNIGNSGGLPVTYALQVAETTAMASGLFSALNFFVQFTPPAGCSTTLFATFGGIQTYGSQAVPSLTGGYYQMRVGSTGLHSNIIGSQQGCVLVSGTSGTTVGSYHAYDAGVSDEGDPAASGTITSAIIYNVSQMTAKGQWTITTLYGFYANDNSSYATTSWGIYNLDRTYLLKDVQFSIGTDNKFYFRSLNNYIYSSAAGMLDLTANTAINLLQDTILAAGKDLDCYTNGGYFKPRRLSQSAIPTPDSAELLVWEDSDDNKTYLVYNDPSNGVRSVEMT